MSLCDVILVVDDQPEVLSSVTEQLRAIADSHGHSIKVIQSSNLDDAIRQFTNNNIDALYLDYQLIDTEDQDERYASELLAEIPDHIDKKNLYLVLMSGYPESDLRNAIPGIKEAIPNFHYLSKPVLGLMLEESYLGMHKFLRERSLPYPLARTLSLMQRSEDSEKFTNAVAYNETLVKFLSLVLISDAHRLRFTDVCPRIYPFQNISSGTWNGILQSMIKCLIDKPNIFVPEICCLHRERYKEQDGSKTSFYGLTERLIYMRNRFIGHAVINPTPDDRARLSKDLSDLLAWLKRKTDFLARYSLIVVESMDNDPEQVMLEQHYGISPESLNYIYKVKSLMGETIPMPSRQFSSTKRLCCNHIYIGSGNGVFLPLHPFFRLNPEDKSEMFIIESLVGNAISYKSYATFNRDVSFSDGYREASAIIGQIAGVHRTGSRE